MATSDPFDNLELRHLQSFVYLIPFLGFLPSLWTLYRRRGSREQRAASRLAIVLGLIWGLGSILLATGAQSETARLPLLITASLLTSSYFVTSLLLMMRLWQRKPLNLPGLGWVDERSHAAKVRRLP